VYARGGPSSQAWVGKGPGSQTVTSTIKHSTTATGANQTTVTYGKATFTITVTNTGDVTLTNVTVKDQFTPSCNRTFSSLAPGHKVRYKYSTLATGSFKNIAVASGKPKSGGPRVSDTSGNAAVVVNSATHSSHTAPKNTG
jgi:uncharacterized repeat protein (TIGR01451 family)